MSQEIRAIYENGLFRPLDPISLSEHDVVSLVVSGAPSQSPSGGDAALDSQRQALLEMFDEADRLPLENSEGFSGADHDAVLYGWKK
jgi:predicted DNA-binding antitoxin AbrB/MazE fold protein